jgi:hypothetical protein
MHPIETTRGALLMQNRIESFRLPILHTAGDVTWTRAGLSLNDVLLSLTRSVTIGQVPSPDVCVKLSNVANTRP